MGLRTKGRTRDLSGEKSFIPAVCCRTQNRTNEVPKNKAHIFYTAVCFLFKFRPGS